MSRDIVVLGLSLALVARVGEAAGGQSDSMGQSSFDTAAYSDAETAELIELARIHHRNRSLRLQGYRAKIFTP